jgi:lipopolysaccharide export system permease protein
VINEVIPGKFYLRAGHLDEATNLMREVTIYDMGDPTRRRTIYADSGNMSMNREMTDLELTLYNGNLQDVPSATPDELQRLYFDTDFIRIRNVGNQFQKTTSDAYKSDREMTVCEMQAAQDKARGEHERARTEFVRARDAAKKLGAKPTKLVAEARTGAPWDVGLGRLYCGAVALFSPATAQAQGPQPPAIRPRAKRTRVLKQPVPESVTTISPGPAPVATSPEMSASILEAQRIRLLDTSRVINAYSVEIHKKFALAVACFVFVLLGAPIALRFPRGGVGLTIGVSLLVFALYYVCLIGGEALGKRGLLAPVIAMWGANVLFGLVAVWLLSKIGREARTARGGDMGEMIDSIRGWAREKLGMDRRRRGIQRAPA